MDQWGLYIHIPFCTVKCWYCDFNAYAGLDGLMPAYTEALVREIASLPPAPTGRPAGPQTLATLYFGGGTPSRLPLAHLETILTAVVRHHHLRPGAEVSLEANPGDLDRAYLRGLRALGITRLSIGAQSFDDAMLRAMGRRHSGAMVVAAYDLARQVGFAFINLDLLYGLPGQDLAHWQRTLDQALALEPDHLSLYALTVEPGTVYAKRQRQGRLPLPPDDLVAEMYEMAEDRLGAAGYVHYEIANWARSPAAVCQHNLTYWRNQPFLGVGAGAHSFDGARRWANVRPPRLYIARLAQGRSPVAEVTPLSPGLQLAETAMLGLRLVEGLDRAAFRARFGVEVTAVFGQVLADLAPFGLLEVTPDRVRLTRRGRLLSNEVFVRLLEAVAGS